RPRPVAPVEPPPAATPSRDGWVWPADGPLTSHFGWRRHPIFGDMRFHAGIDIGAAYGSPTHAADDGVVTYAGPASGYGTLVLISHGTRGGRDVTTGYAHQSALLVGVGDHVARGQQVGRVGNEGNSTGPHLHFEVRLDGDPVDPLDYVSPP
ncbi:MAG: Peptidase, partial [Frankiales bacterium]|nr:Peptidase [Frankiales bacterium]